MYILFIDCRELQKYEIQDLFDDTKNRTNEILQYINKTET